MHVLVIGGTRFVGYGLVWRLLAGGQRVTVLNRGTTPDPFGDRIERLRVDRTTPEFAAALAGRRFDATVDFAAYTGADVQGVLDGLGERAGHYVLISSGQVYLMRPDCPRPARESDYPGTIRPRPEGGSDLANWEYGAGKRAAEDGLQTAWEERGYPSTRLRIPIVNGERDNSGRLDAYLWRILDGGPLLLPHGGPEVARHIYAGAVVRQIVHLLGDESTYGQAYNLAQAEAPSVAGLVGLLADALGAPARLVPVLPAALQAAGLDPRAVSPFSTRWMSYIDPTRAERELGFHHEPLHDYLSSIVASFLAHPSTEPPEGYERRDEEVALARQQDAVEHIVRN